MNNAVQNTSAAKKDVSFFNVTHHREVLSIADICKVHSGDCESFYVV